MLTRYLHAALRSLNLGLPDAAYDDAVRQITATAASQTLAAANREQYDLLRDGVPVTLYFGTCSAPIQQCRRRITKARLEVASLTYV